MNLNKALKEKMVLEFRQGNRKGRTCAEVDELYLQAPGTTERLVRDALRAKPADAQTGRDPAQIVLPLEADLPTPAQMRGIAKGMTEGQLAEDYLGKLRGDELE